MSSVSIPSLLLGGALVAVSAAAAVFTGSFRSSVFKSDHSKWDEKQRYYIDEEDEEVMTDPTSSYYPALAIRSDFFTSTDTSQSSNNISPDVTFKLSIDVFDSALKSLSELSKWPVPYFQSTRERREAERLCYYLLGIADTYMDTGPTTITPTPTTHLSVTLLYLCAANLGIAEAFATPIKRPRQDYGIFNFVGTSTCIAGTRIVEHSSKHAPQNSIITFYELIILFLMSVDEDQAFIYLRNDDWKLFRKSIGSIIELIDNRHPLFTTLHFYKAMKEDTPLEERMRVFDLPRLCQIFNEPFSGTSD